MAAYYNENNAFTAAWLRELIKAGLIVQGDVDERSIKDVLPNDLIGYTQCHFFAGIGGWSYALRLADWTDDRPVWTGSCPCQPFSAAGKRSGVTDDRHLWPDFFKLITKCRPPVVFGEQVASKDGYGWFAAVRTDLEAAGYACGAADLPACSVGAPHIRQRLWFVAHDLRAQEHKQLCRSSEYGDFKRKSLVPREETTRPPDWPPSDDHATRLAEILRKADEFWACGLVDGVPARVGRLRGYGNAIVPQVAAEFIKAYCG